jgi:hypothetical protein
MRRALAPTLAALACLLQASAAVAEPLDLDLWKLGAPDAAVWTEVLAPADAGKADALAQDARNRFGLLTSELALSVTGHSGFDIALEGGYPGVHQTVIGTQSGVIEATGATFGPRDYWPTRGLKPYELFVPAVRIRKALPFSFELGGRLKYLSQSSLWAGQFEAKWAFLEGDRVLPDFAIRLGFTKVSGVRTLNLSATDVDFVVSKRYGVLGVVSLTPYGALRFTFAHASTDPMVFFPEALPNRPSGPTADELAAQSAPFPDLSAFFFRETLGVRLTTYALSIAAEVTHFGGKKVQGGGYDFEVGNSLAGSFRLGFEF